MAVKQLSVFLENKSGQLVGITGVLALNSVDLRAISVAETTDYGVVRLIVSNYKKGKEVLEQNGFIVKECEVCAVEVPDVPGGLNKVLDIFASKSVDIEYMYSLFASPKGTAFMIFKAKESGEIEKALENSSISIADSQNLGIN